MACAYTTIVPMQMNQNWKGIYFQELFRTSTQGAHVVVNVKGNEHTKQNLCTYCRNVGFFRMVGL